MLARSWDLWVSLPPFLRMCRPSDTASRLVPSAEPCSVLPATWTLSTCVCLQTPSRSSCSLCVRVTLGSAFFSVLSLCLASLGSCPRPLPKVMLILCGLVHAGTREQCGARCRKEVAKEGRNPCLPPTPCLCPFVHPSLPSPTHPCLSSGPRLSRP